MGVRKKDFLHIESTRRVYEMHKNGIMNKDRSFYILCYSVFVIIIGTYYIITSSVFHAVNRIVVNATKYEGWNRNRKIYEYVASGIHPTASLHTYEKRNKLLCIGTSFITNNNTAHSAIVKQLLIGMKLLGNSIQPVLFVNGSLSICKDLSFICISNYKVNSYGVPFIRSFFSILQELEVSHNVSCHYYGYMNGDILVSTSLARVLNQIKDIHSSEKKMLIVGRRTNYPWVNEKEYTSEKEYEAKLQLVCKSDEPYMANAIDYFIYTKGTFDVARMKGVVIGRTAVDGYLMSYVDAMQDAITIDLTPALCCVHMTDQRGNKAGEQGNKGKSIYNVKWNESPAVCGTKWLFAFKKRSIATSVSNARYTLYELKNHEYSILYTNGSDAIPSIDYQFIQPYLHNQSCLYFGNGKLADHAFDDCTDGFAVFHDYSIGMPQRIKTNHLSEKYFFFPTEFKYAKLTTCHQLREYIHVPIDGYYTSNKVWVANSYRKRKYGVVIVNGACKHDVIRAISLQIAT